MGTKQKMSTIEKSAVDVMTDLMQHVAANSVGYELRTPTTALSYFFLAGKMADVGKGTACGTRRSITYQVDGDSLVASLGIRFQAKHGQREVTVTKEQFCKIVQAVFRRSDVPVNPMTWRCWQQLTETLKRKQGVRHASRPYDRVVTLPQYLQ